MKSIGVILLVFVIGAVFMTAPLSMTTTQESMGTYVERSQQLQTDDVNLKTEYRVYASTNDSTYEISDRSLTESLYDVNNNEIGDLTIVFGWWVIANNIASGTNAANLDFSVVISRYIFKVELSQLDVSREQTYEEAGAEEETATGKFVYFTYDWSSSIDSQSLSFNVPETHKLQVNDESTNTKVTFSISDSTDVPETGDAPYALERKMVTMFMHAYLFNLAENKPSYDYGEYDLIDIGVTELLVKLYVRYDISFRATDLYEHEVVASTNGDIIVNMNWIKSSASTDIGGGTDGSKGDGSYSVASVWLEDLSGFSMTQKITGIMLMMSSIILSYVYYRRNLSVIAKKKHR